jgi:pyrroline-5-carboxylate reductase
METVTAVAAERTNNLDADEVAAMVRQTVSTVSKLLEAGWSTADICRAVATPGGTTEAALDAMGSVARQGIGYVFDATLRREAHQKRAAVTALPSNAGETRP